MSERPGSPEDERAQERPEAQPRAYPAPGEPDRSRGTPPGEGPGGRADGPPAEGRSFEGQGFEGRIPAAPGAPHPPPGSPGPGPAPWNTGTGGGYHPGAAGGPLRLGPPAYPPGRPDFEPPPHWARPAPTSPNGPPPGHPIDSPSTRTPFGEPPQEKRRGLGAGALVAIIAVVALVAAAAGAGAGYYATTRWANPAQLESVQPITDGVGGKGRREAFTQPKDVSTVAEALLPGVVQIKVTAGGGKATGSGFIIREDGHILTNNHVIAMAAGGQGSISVAFNNGEEKNASIVGRSPSYDLAVIKVSVEQELTPVPLGDSDDVVVGEPVVAVGSPLGLTGTVTSGIISAKNRAVTAGGTGETSFISGLQTDAAINPGNSGGPLANLKAEVIGVNSAIATVGDEDFFGEERQQGSIGLGFAIPINQARRTAGQLIETGHAVYPVVGATVDRSFDGPGARIVDVTPGSGAERAGMRSGDLVTVINGHKVTGADDLIVQIRRHQPGEVVRITYVRSGQPQDVLVTLGEEID